MKRQAVLVLGLIPAPQVKAVECSAEGRRQGQVLDDLHGAGWENAADPVDLPQIPILIQLSEQHDDVPLVEPQLPRVVPSEVAAVVQLSWQLSPAVANSARPGERNKSKTLVSTQHFHPYRMSLHPVSRPAGNSDQREALGSAATACLWERRLLCSRQSDCFWHE